MNGIVIDIDPVIFHIGMFPFRWYALFTIIAAGTAWWVGPGNSLVEIDCIAYI